MMMASLCKELWQFILAQGILLGVSMALLVTPMLALVGQHVKVKRAAAMGIVIAGSSLGGVIWPIVIRELLQKPNLGFPWTMRISGFIMLPLLLISCICCRPAPTPQPTQPTNEDQPASASKEPKTPLKTDFSILKQPKMQLTCLSFFIIYFGMFSPFFYTTSYGIKMGFSDDLSFYTVSIVNGASLFGRILPGIVADKYGKFNCCIVATGLAGIIALCWTKATSVAGLVVWSAAYGFASGVSIPSISTWQLYTNLFRVFCPCNKPAQPRLLHLRPWDWPSGLLWALLLCRMLSSPSILPGLLLTIQGNGWNSYQRPAGWEIRIPGAFNILWRESPGRSYSSGDRTIGAESEFVCYRLACQC